MGNHSGSSPEKLKGLICLSCATPATGIGPCPTGQVNIESLEDGTYCEPARVRKNNNEIQIELEGEWRALPEDLIKLIKNIRKRNKK